MKLPVIRKRFTRNFFVEKVRFGLSSGLARLTQRDFQKFLYGKAVT